MIKYSVGDIVTRKRRKIRHLVRVTHVESKTCCGSPMIHIDTYGTSVCATEYAPVVKKLRDRVCIWICKED